MKSYDIIIVGGGASGLVIAEKCGAEGLSVCVLEANARVGKKIIASGNGRCNLTHVGVTADAYNDNFTTKIVKKYDDTKVVEYFESLGLLTRADCEGRIYPYSGSSTSALNAFLYAFDKYSNVEIVCDCVVGEINKVDNEWRAVSTKGVFSARFIVIASGSSATFGLSSYGLIKKFGHNCTQLSPALTYLKCDEIKGAQGVRVDATAEIIIDGVSKRKENGELLFKDNAISGVLAFSLSSILAREYARGNNPKCALKIDFAPDMTESALASVVEKTQTVQSPLSGILHKAVAMLVINKSPQDRSLLMSRNKAEKLAHGCKNFVVEIQGLGGIAFAQVVSGGLELDGFDDETLMSTKCDNLFAVGEALNVDGLCGGYNLHWAWSSALACSDAIIKKNKEFK